MKLSFIEQRDRQTPVRQRQQRVRRAGRSRTSSKSNLRRFHVRVAAVPGSVSRNRKAETDELVVKTFAGHERGPEKDSIEIRRKGQ